MAGDSLQELKARARQLAESGRALLGIAGPPGAGKTTLAKTIVAGVNEAWPGAAQHVPADGFHLADVELRRVGRLSYKGAPETFDAAGYHALLARLRRPTDDTIIYAPAFDREIEQPVASSIPVFANTRLIVTEGNYLLLESNGWQGTKALFDEIWWVDVASDTRVDRLIARHQQFGKQPEEARTWVHDVDGANARLVEPSRARADLVVSGEVDLDPRHPSSDGASVI